jgi:hypothetical protein
MMLKSPFQEESRSLAGIPVPPPDDLAFALYFEMNTACEKEFVELKIHF